MEYHFSTDATRKLKQIKKLQPKLFKKTQKQLKLFKENPQHPSLRTHKLKGELKNIWSISVERNFRMVYFVEDGNAVFFKIGTHDEVYKSKK